MMKSLQQQRQEVAATRNWGDAYNAKLRRDLDSLTEQLKTQFPDLPNIMPAPYTDPTTALSEINKFLAVMDGYKQEIANKLQEPRTLETKMDWLDAKTSKYYIDVYINDAKILQNHFVEELGITGADALAE